MVPPHAAVTVVDPSKAATSPVRGEAGSPISTGSWPERKSQTARRDIEMAERLAGRRVAILAADNEFHEELPSQFPHFPQAKDVVFGDRAVREESARINATIQVGYFILGVRAAGLAAGPMTGFDAEGIAKEFFPDGDHSVLAVVNIGKPGPEAWFPRSPRLAYEEVVTTI